MAAQCLCDAVQQKTKRLIAAPIFPNPKFPKEVRIELTGPDEFILRRNCHNLLVAGNSVRLLGSTMFSPFLVSEGMKGTVSLDESTAFIAGKAQESGVLSS